MHKQHEDQPSNELPDLSTWHRVPVGATIPKGTPYFYAYENGINVRLDGPSEDFTVRDNSYYAHYTEHAIGLPLPTEEGATILVSSVERPPHILLTRLGWYWFDSYGNGWVDEDILLTRLGWYWFDSYGNGWVDEDIRVWAPVTIGEAVFRP